MTSTGGTTHLTPSSVRFGDQQFIEAYGASWGDTDTLLSFFSVDVRYRDIVSGVDLIGHDVMRKFMKVYLQFSPDCVVKFIRVVAGPDSFAAEWEWCGTGSGPLRLPDGTTAASGNQFSVPGMSFCTIDGDGLIATHTDYWDAGTLLRQLAG